MKYAIARHTKFTKSKKIWLANEGTFRVQLLYICQTTHVYEKNWLQTTEKSKLSLFSYVSESCSEQNVKWVDGNQQKETNYTHRAHQVHSRVPLDKQACAVLKSITNHYK